MTPALLILTGLFLVLLVGRVGAARRAALAPQWPALLFAVAAMVALIRGAVPLALGLATLAGAAWVVTPMLRRLVSPPQHRPDPADAEAARALGVSLDAGEQEVRRAYRAKMASVHPDRGGSHAEAARITAARDHLLKKMRRT